MSDQEYDPFKEMHTAMGNAFERAKADKEEKPQDAAIECPPGANTNEHVTHILTEMMKKFGSHIEVAFMVVLDTDGLHAAAMHAPMGSDFNPNKVADLVLKSLAHAIAGAEEFNKTQKEQPQDALTKFLVELLSEGLKGAETKGKLN